jgi:hypothetical protein
MQPGLVRQQPAGNVTGCVIFGRCHVALNGISSGSLLQAARMAHRSEVSPSLYSCGHRQLPLGPRCVLPVYAALKMQQCQGCVSQLNALEGSWGAGELMNVQGGPAMACHGMVRQSCHPAMGGHSIQYSKLLSTCSTCALSCALLREGCHCCHHVHKRQMVLLAIRLACLMSFQPSLLPVAMVGAAQSAAWGPFKERRACDGVICKPGVTPCARQQGQQLCGACVPLHACTSLPCDHQATLCSLQAAMLL